MTAKYLRYAGPGGRDNGSGRGQCAPAVGQPVLGAADQAGQLHQPQHQTDRQVLDLPYDFHKVSVIVR